MTDTPVDTHPAVARGPFEQTVDQDTFEPETFEPERFEPDSLEPDSLEPDTFEPAESDPPERGDTVGVRRLGSGGGSGDGPPEALLVREGDIAGDYLERLLDIVDYDGDIDLDVEGDRAVVAVIGGELQGLVGPNGVTLEALQELTRLAVQQQTGVRSRLMLDIGGYRARRRTTLTGIATDAAAEVRSSGDAVRLDPMNPFERKVVHDAVALIDGVFSESEGEEPDRRVVVRADG